MEGLIRLSHVPTRHQLADLFTKPLTGIQYHSILSKLGVHPPSNLRGVLEFDCFTAIFTAMVIFTAKVVLVVILVAEVASLLFLLRWFTSGYSVIFLQLRYSILELVSI